MAGYTTVAELRETLSPGGAQDAATAASLSDQELQDFIEEAGQEIDASLRDRHTVPFDPVPDLIAQIARDLAAYLATLTHRRHQPIVPDHPVRLRYDRARKLLEQLATGKLDLDPGEDGGDSSSEDVVVVNRYGDEDIFTTEDLGLSSTAQPWFPPW